MKELSKKAVSAVYFPKQAMCNDGDSDSDCQVVDSTLRMILLQQEKPSHDDIDNSSVVDHEKEQSLNTTSAGVFC